MATIAKPPCDEAAIRRFVSAQPTANGPWILAATILGSSMAFIDGTVVNVALPALQSALRATMADVQWVVESYALFLAALLLIGGSLGDLYGRRKIFASGVVLFTASLGLVRIAPDIRQLIVARGLQGIGGALLVPGSLALISVNFSEKSAAALSAHGLVSRRSLPPSVPCWVDGSPSTVRGDGYFSSIFRWGWRSCCWRCGKSRKAGPSQGRRFDWLGGLLAALGFGGIVFALIESTPAAGRSWRDRPDRAVVLGSALAVADGSAPACSVPEISVEPTCSPSFSTPR